VHGRTSGGTFAERLNEALCSAPVAEAIPTP
jgi:hypothetical protein